MIIKEIEKYLYIYPATFIRAIDGDTVEVELDKGFFDKSIRRLRLLFVDTPERGEKNYKEAREFLTGLIEGQEILVQTYKGDSFGRYLAVIYKKVDNDGVSINEEMIRSGLFKIDSKWNKNNE